MVFVVEVLKQGQYDVNVVKVVPAKMFEAQKSEKSRR